MTFSIDVMSRWLVTDPGLTDSEDRFPMLPGQMLATSKGPMWSTSVSMSTSGEERRRSNWSYPRWRIRLRYEVLRARPSLPELQKLLAFFSVHRGMRSSFSYFDPFDHTATDETLGFGDGTQTVFQLTRTIGVPGLSFTEPVRRAENVVVMVGEEEVSGWEIDSRGRLTLAEAPPEDARVSWSGQFMFLCRFANDEIEPEQMTKDLWSLSGIELITVKR